MKLHTLFAVFLFAIVVVFVAVLLKPQLAKADIATGNDQVAVFAAGSAIDGTATPVGSKVNVSSLNTSWLYVNGQAGGIGLTVPLTPGAYEVRLVVNSSTMPFQYYDTSNVLHSAWSETFWSPATLTAVSGQPCVNNNPSIALTAGTLSGVNSVDVYRGGVLLTTIPGGGIPPSTAANYTDSTVVFNQTYSYYIIAKETDNATAWQSSTVTLVNNGDCPGSIDSLAISTASSLATGFSGGTFGILGRQQAQSGSNWYNPIKLVVSVTQGSYPISHNYVGVYDKSVSGSCSLTDSKGNLAVIDTSGNPVSTLQTTLQTDPSKGFIVRYDPTNQTFYAWNPTTQLCGAVSGPGWCQLIPNSISNFFQICSPSGCNTKIYYTVYSGVNGDTTANTWSVKTDQSVGNRSYCSAVQSTDTQGVSAFEQDITPITGN